MQLSLFAPPPPPVKPDSMTPQERAEFNDLCLRVRQDAERAAAIANELGFTCSSVKELDSFAWSETWKEFHRRFPDPKKLAATQIARELGYSVASIDHLQKTDMDAWRYVWQVYSERLGFVVHTHQVVSAPIKKSRPYRPWSKQRRQAKSLANLVQRLSKKFSIPTLYMQKLQAELIKDPWRYGVCPLPNESGSFPSNVPTSNYLAAIAREDELRSQGR